MYKLHWLCLAVRSAPREGGNPTVIPAGERSRFIAGTSAHTRPTCRSGLLLVRGWILWANESRKIVGLKDSGQFLEISTNEEDEQS